MVRILTVALSAMLWPVSAFAVTFEWATIGQPSNKADTRYDPVNENGYGGLGFGEVDYVYRLSKHEVTNAQYAEFLNAVDPTGDNLLKLYQSGMGSRLGGIENTGVTNGARYVVMTGQQNKPVTHVSWFSALRFTNWLHNGQGSGSTDSGAYLLPDGVGITNVQSIQRGATARFFLPTEDEWYKAAYYDPTADRYYDYPTGTDNVPYSDNPDSLNTPDDSNVANFIKDDSLPNGYDNGWALSESSFPTANPLTDVGAYRLTHSSYGIFDLGGNALEWTETLVKSQDYYRVTRGGSFGAVSSSLHAQNSAGSFLAPGSSYTGFRIAAAIPEPATLTLAALACTSLARRWKRSGGA